MKILFILTSSFPIFKPDMFNFWSNFWLEAQNTTTYTKVFLLYIFEQNMLRQARVSVFQDRKPKIQREFGSILKVAWSKKQNKKYISEIKVRNFMEEQMTMMDNLNQRIDETISSDEQDDDQQFTSAIPTSKENKEWNLGRKHVNR